MALFKIEKGLAANLATNRPNSVEGYCYFTSDDGKFYIDIATGKALTPTQNGGKLAGATRMPINSYMSDWAARAYADKDGNDITSTYGSHLSLSDKYTLKLIAAEGTELSVFTLPKDVDTASKFTSAQTVKLTGAVTGTASSQAGWEIPTTLSDNIVTTSKISNKAVTNEKLANSSITIGGKAVNLGGVLTLADIGLNTALRFIGATSTAITDGSTTSSIVINGSSVTPTIGDVIINNNNSQEYVWLGSAWELLGDESSYALKGHTHNYAGSASAGGAANSAIKLETARTISLTGAVTGSGTFDGSGNLSIATTMDNNSSNYVKKSGDTMTGALTVPTVISNLYGSVSSNFAANTSNYNQIITWYDSDGTTQHSYIGAHNTGNSTGAIIINPVQNAAKDNWSSDQGLYIGKTELKFWGSDVPTFEVIDTPQQVTNPTFYVLKSGDTMSGSLTAPKFIGALQGNADTATKLANPRTISLTGAITGSGAFDGSGDLSITTTANHNHDSSYVKKSGDTMTGHLNNNSEFITTSFNGFRISASSSTNTKSILLRNDGSDFYILCCNNASAGDNWYTPTGGTHPFRINLTTGYSYFSRAYGAVWNDYGEYRICKDNFKPGQVVLENGDDTLSIASQRLQRGCSIVSDTFGFAIGQTDKAKCPIAVSGRVLAYGYESREEFKKHIGWPVCSGPNGTVSIMTEEEEEKYPSRIIGTVSAVPDYETWGTGNVEVNNRIWIKVK